jgi:hypothetical protein
VTKRWYKEKAELRAVANVLFFLLLSSSARRGRIAVVQKLFAQPCIGWTSWAVCWGRLELIRNCHVTLLISNKQ